MTTMANMACPKCGGRMHSFERSRLMVEQCEECRGFFLDLGELERLIDAEGGGWSGRVGPPAEVADPAQRPPGEPGNSTASGRSPRGRVPGRGLTAGRP